MVRDLEFADPRGSWHDRLRLAIELEVGGPSRSLIFALDKHRRRGKRSNDQKANN
jgi:hypothetical protein